MAAVRSRLPPRTKNLRGTTDNDLRDSNRDIIDTCWCPRSSVVFNVLLSARITSAFLSNISDCDETFNYWEPTHYLMYGNGFQTWEYSPLYAIRSYGYLWLHVLPAQIVKQFFMANKITVFYYIRFILGILCAAFETYFFKSLQYQFGGNVARLYFVFAAISTGMFISAAAYLPSTFAMYCCLIAMGGWFSHNYTVAVFGIALGCLVGWPFFVIVGLPIAYDLVILQNKFWIFLQWCVGIFLAIMIPLVAIDTHYYGKQVIAPLNIILYNVFGQGGPNLYGVESWKFYFINGFLNFNILFIMALVSYPFMFITNFLHKNKRKDGLFIPIWLVMSPMFLWMLVFFTQPHKEERFLFPIYPLIILSAVLMISKFQELWHHYFSSEKKSVFPSSSNWIASLVLGLFTLISLSRSAALYVGYHAPLNIYPELHELVTPLDPQKSPVFEKGKQVNVCVGREWYRYPSSFFLPERWKFLFLKSEFSGQLPQPFPTGSDGTKVIPPNMNDMNIEEPSIYSQIGDCDLLIDLDLETHSKYEENYSRNVIRWKILHSKPFLLAAKSHPFFRAFYIPFLSEKYTTFVNYNLLKSRRGRKKARRSTFTE